MTTTSSANRGRPPDETQHGDADVAVADADSPRATSLQAGTCLDDRYELVRMIGQGASGHVYEGQDRKLGRRVAIKLVDAGKLGSCEQRQLGRFAQEAAAAARLNHPNIVTLYDHGIHTGCPYLVFELLQGKTLQEILVRGPLEPRGALDVAIDVAAGLAEAHRSGVLHRDIKPANVFVTAAGRAKILDFGISRLLAESSGDDPYSRAGTLGYIAPERLRGEPGDARTDIFGVGVLVHHAIAGEPPFRQHLVGDLLLSEPDVAPVLRAPDGQLLGGIPAVVARALAIEPEDRYASAGELMAALVAVRDERTRDGGAGFARPTAPRALVGSSPVMIGLRARLARLVDRVRPAGVLPPTLIVGELGTGKTLVARLLQDALPGGRESRNRLACGTATVRQLEAALEGRILLLDDLESLPPALQPALLHLLDEHAAATVISVCRARPRVEAEGGQFLDALMQRLAVFTLELPPLRERGSDVVLLAEHFLGALCAEYGLPPKTLSEDARAALLAHRWPGNVRELVSTIERAALLEETDVVTSASLGLAARPDPGGEGYARAGGGARWTAHRVVFLLAASESADARAAAREKAQAFGGTVVEEEPAALLAVFHVGGERLDASVRAAVQAARALHHVLTTRGEPATLALHVARALVAEEGGGVRVELAARHAAFTLLVELASRGGEGLVLTSDDAGPLVRRFLRAAGTPGAGAPVPFEAALLVGRERERRELDALLQAVRDGRGGIVCLTGEPGIGKSRLLDYVEHAAAARRITCVRATCLRHEEQEPWRPIRVLVRQILGIAAGDDVPPGADPALRHFLGAGRSDLPPEAAKVRAFAAVRRLILASSAAPLVAIIDDVQWLDALSTELLSTLAPELPSSGVLLVVTWAYRPEGRPAFLTPPAATVLPLGPLSLDESASLLRGFLAADAGDERVDAIVARGGGNPFFLEELAHLARESRASAAVALPTTMEHLIETRIATLPAPALRLLELAAVVGDEASLALLEAASPSDEPLARSLDDLVRRELLVTIPHPSQPRYVIRHALVRDAIYGALSDERRAELHGAAGRAIEQTAPSIEENVETLAHHYRRSRERAKALEFLERANRKAIRAHAVEAAFDRFEEALAVFDELPPSPVLDRRRVALVVHQTEIAILGFKIRRYHEIVARHAEEAAADPDPAIGALLQSALGWCEWSLGRLAEAASRLEDAAELLGWVGRQDDAVYAWTGAMWSHLLLGDLDATIRAADESYARISGRREQARAGTRHGKAWAVLERGRADEAVLLAEEGMRLAQASGIASAVCFGAQSLCRVHAALGDVARARAYGELALRNAKNPNDQASAAAQMCAVFNLTGRARETVATLAAVLPAGRAAGYIAVEIFTAYLGEAHVNLGELADARRVFTEMLALAEAHRMRLHLGVAHRWLGDLALAVADPEAAARHLALAADVLTAIGAERELANVRRSRARLRAS